MYFKEIIR